MLSELYECYLCERYKPIHKTNDLDLYFNHLKQIHNTYQINLDIYVRKQIKFFIESGYIIGKLRC